MEAASNLDTLASPRSDTVHPAPPESTPSLPRPGRAVLWLLAFVAVYCLGALLYVAGYGVVLGVLNPEAVQQPDWVSNQIDAHLSSYKALVGMYSVQFVLLMPLVLFAAHFRSQPWTQTLGFRRFSGRQLGLWLGVLAVYLVVQFLSERLLSIEPGAFLESISGSKSWGLAFIMVVLAPIVEEAIFRGYLFTAWRSSRLGLSGTLLVTSLLFSVVHLGQYHWVLMLYLFAFSLILGWAREKTGSIGIPTALHAANNLICAILVVFFGFL
jgi:membrane protease YdiL (CAAX protease family)